MLTVSSNANIVQNKLGQIQSRLPRTVELQTRRFAEILVQEVKNSIRRKGLTWRKKLVKNIKKIPHRFGSGSAGYAVISQAFNKRTGVNYGAWHNYASSGHYVKPTPDKPVLYQWAEENMEQYNRNYPPIFVRPTPFAKSAAQRATRKIKDVLNEGGEISDLLQSYFTG